MWMPFARGRCASRSRRLLRVERSVTFGLAKRWRSTTSWPGWGAGFWRSTVDMIAQVAIVIVLLIAFGFAAPTLAAVIPFGAKNVDADG